MLFILAIVSDFGDKELTQYPSFFFSFKQVVILIVVRPTGQCGNTSQ